MRHLLLLTTLRLRAGVRRCRWKNGDFRIAVSCSRALKTTEIVKIYAGASVSAGKLIHEFGGPGTTTSAPGGVNFANITPGKTAFAVCFSAATD